MKSKHHYEVLDGLRGVAALVVVIYHFMEIAITDYNKNFAAHGYLAVDFFFCLSGFVIAYSYDNRIKSIGLLTFIKMRLIRLYPLVVVGSVLGLFTFLIDPYSHLYVKYGFVKTVILFVTSVLVIPYPIMPERFFNLFSLNAPVWSLFWEFIANLIYASFLYKMSKNILSILVLIAAAIIFYIAGIRGNIGGGWGAPTFIDGFFRVGYSFLMGMILFRSGWVIKNKLGLMGLSLLLLCALLFPFKDNFNKIIDPILVIFYLPLVVLLGSGSLLSAKHKKINQFLGDISYPLYMVHYPFVWIFLTYVAIQKPPLNRLIVIMPVCILLLVILAFLIFKWIDQPIRKYFIRKIKNES